MVNKEMSDFLSKASVLLAKMEATSEIHEKQLSNYEKMMENTISLHKERIDSMEKRWNGIRSTVIALAILCLGYFMTAGTLIAQRPTFDDVEKSQEEFVEKQEVFRGFRRVIEGGMGVLHEKEILTTEEEKEAVDDIEDAVAKEIEPNAVSRSPVEVK